MKPTYPSDHLPAMRVPKGGSSCASCEFLSDDRKSCTNKYFIKWHGSGVLPYPADEFCSDWYEHDADRFDASGTSEGAVKGWDTRGRGRKTEEGKKFFRGTTNTSLDRYLREGIKPAKIPLNVNVDFGYIASRKGYTYVSNNLGKAQAYAAFKKVFAEAEPGEAFTLGDDHHTYAKPLDGPAAIKDAKPVVLTIELPQRLMGKLEGDPDDPWGGAYRLKGSIPRKYITGAQEWDGESWKDVDWKKQVAAAAEDMVKLYFVMDGRNDLHSIAAAGADGLIFNGIHIKGFTSPQQELIQAMISRIPKELIKVKEVVASPEMQPVHGRYDGKGTVYINPTVLDSKQKFGEGSDKINHAQLTLAHEFGHAVFTDMPEKKRDEWRDISGWMLGTRSGQAPVYVERRPGWEPFTAEWTHKQGAKFPRKYSRKSPDEDFADCFAFFITGNEKVLGPWKWLWMRRFLKSAKGSMQASGTSEGAVKGWDTRGRGRKPRPIGKPQLKRWGDRPHDPNSAIGQLMDMAQRKEGISVADAKKFLLDKNVQPWVISFVRKGSGNGFKWEIIDDGKKSGIIKIGKPVFEVVPEQPVAEQAKPEEKQEPEKASSSSEQKLGTVGVKGSHPLGGGANDTMVIDLEDGSKAVFKPSSGEVGGLRYNVPGDYAKREVAAWEVAKLVGMDDMVSPAVMRTINGEKGALLAWQDGTVAKNVDGDVKYDGKRDAERAAIFDYVIGNEDRHKGNWIVSNWEDDDDWQDDDDKKAKLHLIDHGLSFPEVGYVESRQAFIDHAMHMNGWSVKSPIDKTLVQPYIDAAPKITAKLEAMGFDPMVTGPVLDRIDELKNSKDWKDI